MSGECQCERGRREAGERREKGGRKAGERYATEIDYIGHKLTTFLKRQ
jgi:hypothetical protein